jgi:hypothetical protein
VIFEEAKIYLVSWIKNFLDKPHSAFNDVSPCPFARKSLEEDKVIFLSSNVNLFPKTVDILNYDVLVYIFTDDISSYQLEKMTETFNANNPGLVALEDHPDAEEKIQDCVLNNGKYSVIFIQSREKLDYYRQKLKNTGYYDNWSEDYLNDVINR